MTIVVKIKIGCCDRCDNCKASKSALLFLAILEIQGLVELVPTCGEINYDEYCSDIKESVDIGFCKSDINYEDNYEKVKLIVSKVINEDLEKGKNNE